MSMSMFWFDVSIPSKTIWKAYLSVQCGSLRYRSVTFLITRKSFNVNVTFLVPELDTFNRRDHRQIVCLKDEFYYLNVTKNGTYTVRDIFDCTFKCLSNPSCLSLNLASSKGADGTLWCELLSSTKYNNTKEYRENTSTHHFSIKVSQFSVLRVKKKKNFIAHKINS